MSNADKTEGVSDERLEEIRAMHHDGTLLAHVQGLFDFYLGPIPEDEEPEPSDEMVWMDRHEKEVHVTAL
jgi:hypothetical protein